MSFSCRGTAALRTAALAALAAAAHPLPAQRWHELQGQTRSGTVPLLQAILDAGSDALALIVASHPDDRYVLPAIHLRYVHGVRVAVLLATRGGGGQNSLGPESGDALERIRTLETEAGCWHFDGEAYYLDRPDLGFRRTAAETFDEWGRAETLRDLVRLLRRIRPDIVLTTHHAEETHGHDQALAELLPEAVRKAADAAFATDTAPAASPPHEVRALFLGATSTPSPSVAALRSDHFEKVRGASLRRLAHDILLRNHLSPGEPVPAEKLFDPEMLFEPVSLAGRPGPAGITGALPSLFDPERFPGTAAEADALRAVTRRLPELALDRSALIDCAGAAIRALRALPCPEGSDVARRRDRRVEALQRVVRHAAAIRIEVLAQPGAYAVPGEELQLAVWVYAGGPVPIDGIAVDAAAGEATFEAVVPGGTASGRVPAGDHLQGILKYQVPLETGRGDEPVADRFREEQFEPPVQLHFSLQVAGLEIPVPVIVPVDLRPPVELTVVPRMLLFPTTREQVRFTVDVQRNSAYLVQGELELRTRTARSLELRAPAGYRVAGERTEVRLDRIRGDTFEFTLTAPPDRKTGVDVVRISLGASTVALRVHKVDVRIDPRLRVGIVRSMDDALSSVIGAGGFGLHWNGLSDLDLAVGDLSGYDTIVVDVRALRDRPGARRSFRRLLEFCSAAGKRLVVLYHKDIEFDPPGEGFRGAPFLPFQVGRNRVTRADAPVTVLLPDHPLLNVPNRIEPGDWDGWLQERGLYFPSVYAEQYEELLEMHDPGLPPERSALLYARTAPDGGEYVYCALALWRQWKNLHPGSVRLLANLLTPRLPER